METLLHDLRYALRQLRQRPGFTLTAILTLALGIGTTTAVFSLVYSILLRPLPYQKSGQLVAMWEEVKYLKINRPYVEANPRHEHYWKERASSFSDITLLQQNTAGVAQPNEHPRIVGIVRAYANLLSVLGVQPELGRAFLPEEGTTGHDHVAIITHDLWQRTYAGDPQVLGKNLILNGSPLQIVGVLPASFRFPKANVLSSQHTAHDFRPTIGVFVPLIVNQNQYSFDGDYNFIALGRLKDGVSLQQATNQLNTIDAAILHDYAAVAKTKVDPDDLRAFLQPLQEAVVGSISTILWLLFASVGAVLLIACVNLANLQLARASSREKELSVRTALGATPFRLLSTALYESLLLALFGGLLGLLLAHTAIRLFLRHAPLDLPRLDEVGIHPGVLLFAIAITALTGIAFGILPALKSLRLDPQAALQQGGSRAGGESTASHTRAWLIGTEVFAATTLLIIMGLLDRSLLHLLDEHRGFTTSHVYSASVQLTGPRFKEDASVAAFEDEILKRLRALPGVESAGLVSAMPLSGESWVDAAARTDKPEGDVNLSNYRWISPDYLATVRIPLLRGRLLTEADRTLKSALISERTAKTIWPDQDPLGHQFRRGGNGTYTVVGIVADTRGNSLKEQPGLMVYMPYWDNPPNSNFFMVRTAQDSAAIEETLRRQIWSYDPEANILDVRSLDDQVDESLAPERSQALVLSAFGMAALALATLGIYGVLSYSVSRRVRELGIRIALGASSRSLYILTMTEAAWPVLAGLVCGIVVSMLAGYAIRSLLYGIAPINVPVTAVAAAIFLLAAALAAFFPARRAAAVDPMESLRLE